MEKIKIKICVGTHCYVLGAAELIELEDHLSDELKDKVEISASNCLSNCDNIETTKRPPFVEIDGKILEKASIPKIIKELNNILSANK